MRMQYSEAMPPGPPCIGPNRLRKREGRNEHGAATIDTGIRAWHRPGDRRATGSDDRQTAGAGGDALGHGELLCQVALPTVDEPVDQLVDAPGDVGSSSFICFGPNSGSRSLRYFRCAGGSMFSGSRGRAPPRETGSPRRTTRVAQHVLDAAVLRAEDVIPFGAVHVRHPSTGSVSRIYL